MKKNEEFRRLDDIQADAVLTTGGGDRAERTKTFTWWRKLTGDKVHFNTLTRFHTPAEVKGEGILFLERKGGESDVTIYLPSFKKVRRVERNAQSGSFMGSEFSYSDISTPHVEDFKYKTMEESADCPDGGKCAVIESTPATDTVKERTGYSRSVSWVRLDNSMIPKSEHYDLEGKLLKRVDASDFREVDPAKHKWMGHKIRVENLRKGGRFTVLEFKKTVVNQGVPDSTFTQQNLSRVQ